MDTVVLVSSCAAHFKCYSSFHLVPIDQTTIKTLYIFVEIGIDSSHLVEAIRLNFPNDRQAFRGQLLEYEDGDARTPAGQKIGETRHLQIEGPSSEGEVEPSAPTELTMIALVSTIQFVAALQRLKEDLTSPYSDAEILPDVLLDGAQSEASAGDVSESSSGHRLWTGSYEATIPRSKPLSPGEILGCTAPIISDADALIYLGDGRFHLNPSVPAFRYDPYSKNITRELYNHEEMRTVRDDAVQKARKSIATSSTSDPRGAVAVTDDNPGSFKQMQAITHQLSTSKTTIPYIPILLSELSPAKLALFNPHISTFIQTSCPRLSIDWGYAFDKPLLSPYETAVAVGRAKEWMTGEKDGRERIRCGRYPMDFYEAGSPWAVVGMGSAYL
ncbi:diphthamide biosynthesis protein [Rhizopogon salebrosus TDB-379]|nr:diphthamide biosynthesis protein [Rhizopogon salebrosus TDB-379]